MNVCSIDIETYSSVNLKKAGVYKYVEADDFDILMVSYAINGGRVKTVDLTDELAGFPEELLHILLSDEYLKTAYNANFEIVCFERYLSRLFGRIFKLHYKQWECTMVRAGSLGLPMNLDGVSKVMALAQQKDGSGKRLINLFSKPCKPTKTNGMRTRNFPHHFPGEWRAYLSYNAQDVRTEMAIRSKILHIVTLPSEARLWALDQRINSHGVKLDRELVIGAIRLHAEYKALLTDEAVLLTGLRNPNSTKQLREWLSVELDEEVETLRKDDLPVILAKTDSEIIKRVLELRREMNKTSVRKYVAMLNAICSDDHIRGTMQFGGANRTMRWAGRLVQVHNLPRNTMPGEVLHYCRLLVKLGLLQPLMDFCELVGFTVSDVLSQLIRTAFIPSEGNVLGVLDYSAIEARVIAWLAGEKWRMDVFKSHGKIYEASASQMFKIDIKTITKDSPYRQRGKVAELALGYQGGVNALIKMGALDMGIPRRELRGLVNTWRKANPEIVKIWADVQYAAESAIRYKGQTFRAARCSFQCKFNLLLITLPSGRNLSYVRPRLKIDQAWWVNYIEIIDGETYDEHRLLTVEEIRTLLRSGKKASYNPDDPMEKVTILYDGMDQSTKRWGVQETYGGKLTENITQAIARDCLADAMLRLSADNFQIVMHVHDEVLLLLAAATAKDRMMYANNIMSQPIPWAVGLPLRVEGFTTEYYKKD